MDRYIGLDGHSASCTLAVIGPSGKRLNHQVVETNGEALVNFIRAVPGSKHLCLEEGTQAAWLHEILSPHVDEIVVAGVGPEKRRGSKSDRIDAFDLAEKLRVGTIKQRVYKNVGEFGLLAELGRAYRAVMRDSVRVQSRLKTLFRSRGVPTTGKDVYAVARREDFIRELPARSRPRAETLYLELDALLEVRKKAKKELLVEARKHRAFHTLRTIPGLGDLRVATLLPIVITPYRFRNKRVFWAYIGLAIVTRSSSDWKRTDDGTWIRAKTEMTRGLNRNYNRALKTIYKGAASTVMQNAKIEEPIYQHYLSLLDGGTKPNLAKLTIARQLASVTLSLWRSGEEYDAKKMKKN
jgi:transposase